MPEAQLDGLVDLACRDGVDVRPTLLRVLTDLYVQKASHSAFEQIQYVELALGLIDGVDDATREAVAASLASYPAAPAAVLDRLAGRTVSPRIARHADDDDGDPAASADAAPYTGNTATRGGWTDDAFAREQAAKCEAPLGEAIFADSGDIHVVVPETLADTGAPTNDQALHASDEIVPHQWLSPDSDVHDDRSPVEGEAPVQTDDLVDLFFFARPEERRLILLSLDAIANGATQRAAPASVETITQLENAALQRRVGDFADRLTGALGVNHDVAARIARDPFGEPIVVAAKALTMQAAVLQRILLFLNPVIGQSVQRVYELAELFNEITPEAAHQMLAIWQQAGKSKTTTHPAPRRPEYEPVYDDADRSDSRGKATTPRRHRAGSSTRRQKRVKSAG
ncbi:MAG: hypothetical protein GC182_21510 [Rhodopseudomonas sp.]|nr:hypothetical protein [Rhodopseudomonas sp.]